MNREMLEVRQADSFIRARVNKHQDMINYVLVMCNWPNGKYIFFDV